jgi:hypothetical protein
MKKFIVNISKGYYGFNMQSYNIPVYVDELTDCMQVRIAEKSSGFSLFECGLDYRCKDVWTSTIGVWGANIEHFITHYLQMKYRGSLDDIKYIMVCDDPIHEDRENDKVDAPIVWNPKEMTEVNNIGE